MNAHYTHKTILITGASGGLGEALSQELSKVECTLILAARNTEKLHSIAQSIATSQVKVHVLPLDLSAPKSIAEASSTLQQLSPQIDVLINNAGVSQRGLAIETKTEVMRKIMEVNFLGTIDWTNRCLPLLQKSKDPRIIVMSSVVGLYGFKERSSYAASKHALQGYFESMQLEGNRPAVTIVSPGRVNTEISKHALNATGDSHAQMDAGQANGMDANVAARRILHAAAKRKKSLYLGKGEVLMIYLHRYFPFLFRTIAKNISAR